MTLKWMWTLHINMLINVLVISCFELMLLHHVPYHINHVYDFNQRFCSMETGLKDSRRCFASHLFAAAVNTTLVLQVFIQYVRWGIVTWMLVCGNSMLESDGWWNPSRRRSPPFPPPSGHLYFRDPDNPCWDLALITQWGAVCKGQLHWWSAGRKSCHLL